MVLSAQKNSLRSVLRLVLVGVCGFAFLCGAAASSLAAHALAPDRAALALGALTRGVGSVGAMQAEFVQQVWLAELSGPITARGRVSFQVPNRVRWEYFAPSANGFVLSGNTVATWTSSGGARRSFPFRAHPHADEMARLIIGSLAFNEEILKKLCSVDVLPAADFPELFTSRSKGPEGYVLRLTPKNDMARKYLSSILLAFTPDGKYPLAASFTSTMGGKTRFLFSNILTDSAVLDNPEQQGALFAADFLPEALARADARAALPCGNGAKLFSAMVTEGREGRIPLMLLVIPELGGSSASTGASTGHDRPPASLRLVVMTETFIRLGSLDIAAGVTLGASVPDSRARLLFTKIGTALGRIFLAPQGAHREARGGRDGAVLWSVTHGAQGTPVGSLLYKEGLWSLGLTELH